VPGDRDAAAFENIVFCELQNQSAPISYWRSTAGFEVDFILEIASGLKAVQVAYSLASEPTREREVRALLAANAELGISELSIVTLAEEERITIGKSVVQTLPIYRAHELR
jgi:predicted AAA+ superfamily ATPase